MEKVKEDLERVGVPRNKFIPPKNLMTPITKDKNAQRLLDEMIAIEDFS